MPNIFIFHGTGGHPQENWFPYLKKELEKLNCKVFVPQFPTPENQTLQSWFKVLEEYKIFIDKNSILVGHSLGGAFLLKVLERFEAKAAFIVAAPVGILPIKNFDSDRKFLENFEFDFEKIKANCKKFYVFHSDNDPYVCLGNGKETSANLETELIFIENAGHFNEAAGYTEFKTLLEEIKKEL